jgi:hypothetical protein
MESDRATTYTHHRIPLLLRERDKELSALLLKGRLKKICHYLIDKAANFHRHILNWFIYNNIYANRAGYQLTSF